jgi:hypothetical protein
MAEPVAIVEDVIDTVLSNFDAPARRCDVLEVDGAPLTRKSFGRDVLSSRAPVHVRRGIPQRHLERWNLESLTRYLQGREDTLWVIRGHAEQGGTNLVEISMKDYLAYLLSPEKRAGDEEPLYVTISKEFMRILPDMAKELELDKLLPMLHSCDAYAFLGPERTVTGLHADTYHSLFYQVWGNKTFVLLPPASTPNVYVSQKYEWSTRLSRVNLESPEHNRAQFPRLRHCTPYVAEVSTGDMLWIPVGWFHYVYATEPSFSISFFLANFARTITYAIWENWIKRGLHQAGLFGRRHGCTCHPTPEIAASNG